CTRLFFFSSRRRHTRFSRDWSSDVCSSDLDLKKREASYYKAKTPYDALIRQFDKNFTVEDITQIFSELRRGLTKLAKKVNEDGQIGRASCREREKISVDDVAIIRKEGRRG